MITQNNAAHLIIADDVARTANIQVKDENAANFIADGESAVVDADGTVLTVTAVLGKEKVRVVYRAGDDVIHTPDIFGRQISSYLGSAFSAAQEQITHVGFDGVAGAIDNISENDYLLRIIRHDTQATYKNKEMLKFGAFRSDSSATQEEVAAGIIKSLIANFSREKAELKEQEINFERLVNDAGAVVTGTGTMAVVNGQKTITAATDIDAVLVAGDTIRFGTAITDPVYQIVSIDATAETAQLDVPYQGTTDAAVAEAAMEVIIAATAATSDFGLQMTGVARRFKVGEFKYSKVRFDVTLDDFGTTDGPTDAQGALDGIGAPEFVSELEWFIQGNRGFIERIGVPPPTPKNVTKLTDGYSMLYLTFLNPQKHSNDIMGNTRSPIEVYIAMSKGTDGLGALGGNITDNTNGTIDVLDDWVADLNVGTAQEGNL